MSKLPPFVISSLVLSGALVLACTSSTASTPGADGGAGADGGSAGSGDGGLTGSDGAGGTAGGRTASIGVTQTITGGTVVYSVSAGFSTLATQGSSPCTSQTFGACRTARCPISDAGAPPAVTGENAGTITVTGAGSSSAVLTFDQATKRYTAASGSTQFFQAGDTITAIGAGDVVPAFPAQTLTAPSEVTFTAPACAATACPDLDRTTDMAVAWTNGGAGDVEFAIETTSDVLSTNVFCTFKASDGAGVVPAAAMATLDKADGTLVTGLEIMFPIDQTTFAVGSYPAVSFSVQGTGAEGFAKMAN